MATMIAHGMRMPPSAEDWQDVEDRHAKADQDRIRDLQQREPTDSSMKVIEKISE